MPDKTSTQHNISLFLWAFITLNVVFAYYQMVFFWGNHDWDWVKGTTQVLSLDTGVFEGRYAKFILNVVLFGGQILPLLNTQVAFALLATGQVLLVNYWQIKQPAARVIVALIPVLAPFILGWLFFPINILGNFAAVPLGIGGLILAEKRNIKSKIVAILCFLIALGVYPSVIEMIFVCWSARQILVPPAQNKNLLSSAATIIIALFIFKFILYGLEEIGLLYMGHYNMQTASLSEMLSRLPQTLELIFSQMLTTLPFFPLVLKGTGIALVIAAFAVSIRYPINAVLWSIMLGATVLSTFLTAAPDETAYMPRVNFYGLNYLYSAAAAIILQQGKIWKNIGLILSVLFICVSVNQDIEAQKVWHLGKTAEERLVERILHRIEEKNVRYPLTPIIAGELPLRPHYYDEKYIKPSPYILNAPLMVRHIPSGMFNFYMPIQIFKGNSQISTITPELLEYLKTASQPWPATAGMYIDDNYVILLLTTDGIKAIQAQLP